MKKIILITASLIFCGFAKSQTNDDTATTIADAIIARAIAINNLPQSDYCYFNTTMNGNLSNEDIVTALSGNTEIEGLLTIFEATEEALIDVGASEFASKVDNMNLIAIKVGVGVFGGTINGGPCSVYNAAMAECATDYSACAFWGGLGCAAFSGPFVAPCLAAAFGICTASARTCIGSAKAGSPGCSGGGGGIIFNPWVETWGITTSNPYCNQ